MVDNGYGNDKVKRSWWMGEGKIVSYQCRMWLMLFSNFDQIG